MPMRGLGAIAASVVVALAVLVAWPDARPASGSPQDSSPKRMVGGKGLQYFGVQTERYLGWTNGPIRNVENNVAIIRAGSRRIRIKPRKGGSVLTDIDGDTAIYTRVTKSESDIEFFDIRHKKSRHPPKGVNTNALEKRATVSGDLMLFSRIKFRRRWLDYRYAREQVILFNLRTHKRRILVDARTDRNRYALVGQINGDWATWYQCRGRGCKVRRMNVATGKVTTASTKRPVGYAPSVTAGGTVFFAASGYICGTRVQLYRWPLGGKPRLVYNEGRKIDTFTTYALTLANGTERVVFDLNSCTKGGGDVYRMDFRGPSPPSSSPSPSSTPSSSPSSCGLPVCPSLSPPLRS